MDSAVSHSTVYIILTEIYSIRSLGRNSIRILFHLSIHGTNVWPIDNRLQGKLRSNRPSSFLSSSFRVYHRFVGHFRSEKAKIRGRGSRDGSVYDLSCWLYYADRIGLRSSVQVQFDNNKTVRYFKSCRRLFLSVSMASLICSKIFVEMKKIHRHVQLLHRCNCYNETEDWRVLRSAANRWPKNICLARFSPRGNCRIYIWKSIIFENSMVKFPLETW